MRSDLAICMKSLKPVMLTGPEFYFGKMQIKVQDGNYCLKQNGAKSTQSKYLKIMERLARLWVG